MANRDAYTNKAKKEMTQESFLCYQDIMVPHFGVCFAEPVGYQSMERMESILWGCSRHNEYFGMHVKLMSNHPVHQPVYDSIVDVRMKVAAMIERTGGASSEGVIRCLECDQIRSKGHVCPNREVLATIGPTEHVRVERQVDCLDKVQSFPTVKFKSASKNGCVDKHLNTLLKGGLTPRETSEIISNDHVIIKHTEHVSTIIGDGNFRRRFSTRIGPSGDFPDLNSHSKPYKYYRIHGMAFDYRPRPCVGPIFIVKHASGLRHRAGPIGRMKDYSQTPSEVSWTHMIDCVRSVNGSEYEIGVVQERTPDMYLEVVGPKGNLQIIGDLWVTYEVEVWGSKGAIIIGADLFDQYCGIVHTLGAGYGVLDYFAKPPAPGSVRMILRWLDSNGYCDSDSGYNDLEMTYNVPGVGITEIVVRRRSLSMCLSATEMLVWGMAMIVSKWNTDGDDFVEVDFDQIKVYNEIWIHFRTNWKNQVSIASSDDYFDVLSGVGGRFSATFVPAQEITSYYDETGQFLTEIEELGLRARAIKIDSTQSEFGNLKPGDMISFVRLPLSKGPDIKYGDG